MSPIAINALLEFHFLGEPRDGHYAYNRGAIRQLICADCIESNPHEAGFYGLTDRGKAMVEFLQEVQLPIQIWVKP